MINSDASKHVVLVDINDNPIGVIDKAEAHNNSTLLHRGFSVFLMRNDGKFLVQKRHSGKKTWGGFWSNSFCGHPQFGETYEQAIVRHGRFELGININNIEFSLDYSYSCEYNNIVENEICPIYLVMNWSSGINGCQTITPNKNEIDEIDWMRWEQLRLSISKMKFSPWCIEEIDLLDKNEKFCTLINKKL